MICAHAGEQWGGFGGCRLIFLPRRGGRWSDAFRGEIRACHREGQQIAWYWALLNFARINYMPTSQAAGPGSLGVLWSTRLVGNSSGTERSSIFLLPRSWMHVEVAHTVLTTWMGRKLKCSFWRCSHTSLQAHPFPRWIHLPQPNVRHFGFPLVFCPFCMSTNHSHGAEWCRNGCRVWQIQESVCAEL